MRNNKHRSEHTQFEFRQYTTSLEAMSATVSAVTTGLRHFVPCPPLLRRFTAIITITTRNTVFRLSTNGRGVTQNSQRCYGTVSQTLWMPRVSMRNRFLYRLELKLAIACVFQP